MTREIKGFIHVHSDYSYDGKNSIDELAAFFAARNYRFICLTEHADDFVQGKMDSFVKDCLRCSTDDFTIVPGLEYRCNDLVHLLAIGVRALCFSNDPSEVINHIKQNGGIAIVAHPRGYEQNLTHDLLRFVDGIEIWSGQKDSRFFPHWKVLDMFKKLKEEYSSLIGLGGADLHSLEAYFPLDMMVETSSEAFSESQLTSGISSIQGAYWTLNLGPDFSFRTMLALRISRLFLKTAKILLGR